MTARARVRSGVAALLVVLLSPACTGSKPTDPRRALANRIDALASEASREGPLAGASIAVASRGKVLLAKGYGMADVEARVRAGPNTAYRLGSVTKQFTAAAIMDLVERGRLRLDDEVASLLPEFVVSSHHATVRHLLTHTSGIQEHTVYDGGHPDLNKKQLSREDLVKLFTATTHLPPGREWEYSNAGYQLLGLIVEKVSGTPYGTYLSERIFAPLGMRDTAYCRDKPTRPGLATGYEAGADGKLRPAGVLTDLTFGAGGLCSTVEDLVKWNEAFHSHRFLNAASYRLMTTPVKLSDGRTRPYGFGLGVYTNDMPPTIAHDGGEPGFVSWLAYYPDERTTVVVLVNSLSPAGNSLVSRVKMARTQE